MDRYACAALAVPAASARLRRPPPAQAPLPPASRPLRVAIEGELAEDAQMRIEGATGRAIVSVVLRQGGHGSRIRAERHYGDGYDAHDSAGAAAGALRQGVVVRVLGEGLRDRWLQGERVYAVGMVLAIEVLR